MVSFPLFLLAVAWLLYKLFSEKPCPPGHMYDMEKANEDMINGVSFDERERRKKRGEYWSPQSEVYDKRKAKQLSIFCKSQLKNYCYSYIQNYSSIWDIYKKEFKDNKDSKGNILHLDDEAQEIFIRFHKYCLENFHKKLMETKSELAKLEKENDFLDWKQKDFHDERVKTQKRLVTYYEEGIEQLRQELGITADNDPYKLVGNLPKMPSYGANQGKRIDMPYRPIQVQSTEVGTGIEDSSNDVYDAHYVNKNVCASPKAELEKKAIQLLDVHGFSGANLKVVDAINSDYHHARITANKENRKYALDFYPITHASDVCVHNTFIECLHALCSVDIENAGVTFYSRLKNLGMYNIELNLRIRTLAVTLYRPAIYISGTIYFGGHKYRIQVSIELLNDKEQNIYISKEGGISEEESFEDSNQVSECADADTDAGDVVIVQNAQLDFDSMNGHEFETFCADILRKNGYEDVTVTRGSGDQGIDVIANKDDVKYGIQCKCYASDVGNKAVQEVFSGKAFYNCHVGVVLTNSYFTHSAIELARSNGIVLWNRDKLLQMIESAKRTEGETT